MKNCLNKNILKQLPIKGRNNAKNVFVIFNVLLTKYNGNTTVSKGTIYNAIIALSMRFFPGNLNLANAYPHKALTGIPIRSINTIYIILFSVLFNTNDLDNISL